MLIQDILRLIDTKQICASQPELNAIFGTATQLEQLRFETNKEAFNNPRIDMHQEFPRYLTEMAHEAGYDAYMTGAAFIKMISYLDKARNPEKYPTKEEKEEAKEEEEPKPRKVDADGWDISESEDDRDESQWNMEEEEEVFNYGSVRVDLSNSDGSMDDVFNGIMNRTSLVRTAYDYFDFVHPETISTNNGGILISYPTGTEFNKDVSRSLFSKYGKHIVEKINDTSSFVVFENLKEPVVLSDNELYNIQTISDYISLGK